MTDTANVNYMEDEKLQKEIVAKVKELREADPKLKRVFLYFCHNLFLEFLVLQDVYKRQCNKHAD